MEIPRRLLSTHDEALAWRTQRDLLGARVDPDAPLGWPVVTRILRRQRRDGRFVYPAGSARRARSAEDYDQLETYKTLLELVSQRGLTIAHAPIARAVEFLFRHLTPAGDLRGIYGRQYSPNYTAAMLALVVEAGMVDDARVERCFRWLASMRQDDGGWAIPLRTTKAGPTARVLRLREPIEPDRSKPSSHWVTGIVLRAFAAHQRWRDDAGARAAGSLLARRFFRPDAYVDRRDAGYWKKLVFPFRWTDVLSSLDALSLLGFDAEEPNVARGIRWLRDARRRDGTWACGYPNAKDPNADLWVTFAACRTLARFDREGGVRR